MRADQKEELENLRKQHELLKKMLEQQEQLRALQGRQEALMAMQDSAEQALAVIEDTGEIRSNTVTSPFTIKCRPVVVCGVVILFPEESITVLFLQTEMHQRHLSWNPLNENVIARTDYIMEGIFMYQYFLLTVSTT